MQAGVEQETNYASKLQSLIDTARSTLQGNVSQLSGANIIAFILLATPITTSLLIAGYCYRVHLPFFQTLKEIGTDALYLNAFSLAGIAFFTAFVLSPNFSRAKDPSNLIERHALEDIIGKFGFKNSCLLIYYLLPDAATGLIFSCVIHVVLLILQLNSGLLDPVLAVISILVLVLCCGLSLLRLYTTGRAWNAKLSKGLLIEDELRFLRQSRTTMQLISFYLILPLYVLFVSFMLKSNFNDVILLFLGLPLFITLAYIIAAGPKPYPVKVILGFAGVVVTVLLFFWPGSGRIAGATLGLLNEGNFIAVSVYIKEESKTRYPQEAFRALEPEDIYPNPLKQHLLLLHGSSRLFVTAKRMAICERELPADEGGVKRCPRALSIPLSDVQSIRYE